MSRRQALRVTHLGARGIPREVLRSEQSAVPQLLTQRGIRNQTLHPIAYRADIERVHQNGREALQEALENMGSRNERRSVKYENTCLRDYENGTLLRRGLTEYFDFYNARRTHQVLDYQTPDDVYYGGSERRLAA